MKCQNSIFSYLDLINSDYTKKDNWMNLFNNIEIEYDIKPFVQYIESELSKNSNNELIYDIIDFIVDFCSENVVKLISQDWFLNSFLSSLKKGTNISVQIQMKIIFLIQKWSLNNSYNYPNFRNKYEYLKSNSIIFPDSHFQMKTYDKYFDKKSFIKDYKSINATDFTFNNFNQKYDLDSQNESLQNDKLNNQNQYMNNNYNINIITYGNPYSIDINENNNKNNNLNNKNINNNNKSLYPNFPYNEILEQSINHPEQIKKKYIEKINLYNNYINEENSLNNKKLKEKIYELNNDLPLIENLIEKYSNNHQLLSDFINIRNDIEQTLFRYDNLKNGNQIEPFISSFHGNNKRYRIYINNSNYFDDDNDEKISKMRVIKNSLYNLGSKIKEKGINGYDYLKGKINKDKQNSSFEDTYYNNTFQNNFNTYGTYRVNDDKFNENENKGILNNVKEGLSKVGNKISNVFKKKNN